MAIDRLVPWDRIPPQSLEMEQATLGAMLVERVAIEKAAEILRPEDFYRDAHRVIFEAILALYERDEPVDLLTLQEQLRLQDNLAAVGGVPYLFQLTESLSTAANVEHYAKIVEEKAILRRVIDAGSRLHTIGHSEYEEIGEVIAAAHGTLDGLIERALPDEPRPMSERIAAAFEEIEEKSQNPGMDGLSVGIPDLDFMTGGIRAGEMIILAARPSVGKSSLALQIAAHVAEHSGPVGYFALEMTAGALSKRLIACRAKVPLQLLRRGELEDHHWRNVGETCAAISNIPLYIQDKPVTISGMRAYLRALARRVGLAMAVVDYLQLVPAPKASDNRNQELTVVSRSLRGIAMEMNVPVLCVAAVNRQPEGRADKRPRPQDLRECGAIEFDADHIWMLHPGKAAEEGASAHPVDLYVDKQRDGSLGVVPLLFSGWCVRFDAREDGYSNYSVPEEDG